MAKIYLKRFAAWVTGLKAKYWDDPFFRGEFNIIIMQVAFAVVLVIFVLIYFQNMRGQKFWLLFCVIGISTVAFSYIIAKIILRPARNALASQKRFISDIAHELRTPLSIIKTNSEVAMLDKMNSKLSLVFKSNIAELDRISEIINNLLSLSKMVKPQGLAFKNVDLGFIIDSVVNKLKDLAASKHIKVAVKKMSPNIVWANSAALEQVVMNLLKNAINYSPEKTQVTIESKPDYRGNVILSVEYNGFGIKEEDLVHIFEPFYRADKSRSRSIGSSGLGLTIVGELVKIHNGRITIKSRVNHGTTAIVALPAGKTFSAYGSEEEGANEVSMDFLRR